MRAPEPYPLSPWYIDGFRPEKRGEDRPEDTYGTYVVTGHTATSDRRPGTSSTSDLPTGYSIHTIGKDRKK